MQSSLFVYVALFCTACTVHCISVQFDHETIPIVEKNESNKSADEDPSVSRFRDYLRCVAVHPEPDYNSSIAWIKTQAEEIGLEYNIVQFENTPTKFAIWLTWRGRDENLPSILLNSHIDVVTVELEKWTHDPFGAEKDENGNIYGRGSQDMKAAAVQYLEAIRNLKAQHYYPLRNVHLSFVPDEEPGGSGGMKLFSKSPEFENLNVGFALDEGMARLDDKYNLLWTEKAAWQLEFTAGGQAGHGSILHNNTAAEKIQKLINSFFDLRAEEKRRMESEGLDAGEVTSINLTIMKGGAQVNVVPSEMSVTFDIRITPHWNHTYVQNLIDNITAEAGPDVTYRFLHKTTEIGETPLTPENIWWQAMQSVANDTGFELVPMISPVGTDSRYLRDIGIAAFGFCPMNGTPGLMHDHNEFLNENIFLNGVAVYQAILIKIMNLTD